MINVQFSLILELLRNAWKNYKFYVLVILFENICSSLLPLIDVAGIGIIIDKIMKDTDKTEILHIILFYIILNVSVSLLKLFFQLLHNLSMRKATDKIQLEYIRDGIIVDYHWAQDGAVLDRKKKSMGANPLFSFIYFGTFINHVVKFMGVVYIFVRLSPFFLLLLGLTSAFSVIFTFKKRKIDFDLENEQTEDKRKLQYIYSLMTRYEYAKEIRINDLAPFVLNKYKENMLSQLKRLQEFLKKKFAADGVLILITVLQSIIMYFYFSYSVYTKEISLAEYSVLIGAVTILTSTLMAFFDNIALIGRLAARMEIFLSYKKWMKENSSIFSTNEREDAELSCENFEIRFEHVSFRYPGMKEFILKDINFTIKNGKSLALVGLNGAGKTTLVKLILRLYKPEKGRIFLNNMDINEIPLRQYLEHVCAVLQDFTIFAYSMKENIVFDSEEDRDRVDEVLEKSGLKRKVESLKAGADTVLYKELDAQGIELSGGESQKLALARALYRQAQIMILDEPTSSLDPAAEYEMFSNLYEIAKGKTTLFISHRLSSTRFCDSILVLSGGKIVEEGTACQAGDLCGYVSKAERAVCGGE